MQQERAYLSPANSNGGASSYGETEIDLVRLINVLWQKIWAIILVGVIFATGGFFFSKVTYVETYAVKSTLEFTTTKYIKVADATGKEELVTVVVNYEGTDNDRYQFLLKSDIMINRIIEATGSKYSSEELKEAVSIVDANPKENNDDSSGFFDITVSSHDPQMCSDVMKAIIDVFPDFIRSSSSTLGIRLVNYPEAPEVDNSDNAVRNAALAFIIGAVLVAGLAVVVELYNNTVKTADDIRNITGTPILGSIPYVAKNTGIIKKHNAPMGGLLITDEDKVSFAFVECFKSIRTKIEGLSNNKGYKTFLVSSTYENEGKTTVAINIACSLAQKGKSVLLIDADLRKPAIMRTIGVKDDDKSGLIPIIKGKSTYKDSIKYVKSLGLFLLPSGGITQQSSEILDADKVREVIETARNEFDFVIIDTPPARVVSDSLVISTLADAMIFVVRKDHAKISEISETIEEITETGIDIAGSVMTMNENESRGRILNKNYGMRNRRNKYSGYGYGYSGKYSKDAYGYGYYGEKGSFDSKKAAKNSAEQPQSEPSEETSFDSTEE